MSTFASLEDLVLCVYHGVPSVCGRGTLGVCISICFFYDLRMGVFSSQISYVSLILSLQVHKLEPDVWKNVEAIYIDIADRSQVLPKVW